MASGSRTRWRGALLPARWAQVALAAWLALSLATLAAPPASGQDEPLSPTGYTIERPFRDYVVQHGGARTFGYPVSSLFRLLGRDTQIFQRQVLQLDGAGVAPLNLLDDALPVTRLAGLRFPAAAPDLARLAPQPGTDGYHARALEFVDAMAPDRWNGLAVSFGTTFRSTVQCADAFPDGPCDEGLLPALALEVWGLPTSRPAFDPSNPGFVYQRFQRGVMHYDRALGVTEGLLLGDWFKQVMIGHTLPPDLLEDMSGSRFFAQYAPAAPGGVARPAELPETDLTGAFIEEDGVRSAGGPGGVQGRTPAAATGDECGDERLLVTPPSPYAGTELVVSATSAIRHPTESVRLMGPLPSGPARERAGLDGWVWEWTITTSAPGSYSFTMYVDTAACADLDIDVLPLPGSPSTGATADPAASPTATHTPRPTRTPRPTATVDAAPPVDVSEENTTPTRTPTPTRVPPTASPTRTPTPTRTPSPTPTASPTFTRSPTRTALPTAPPTATPAAPSIADFSPPSSPPQGPGPGAACGETLVVRGAGFGATSASANGSIWFGGQRITTGLASWSDTAISFVIPRISALSFTYAVEVHTDGGSDSHPYTLRQPCT